MTSWIVKKAAPQGSLYYSSPLTRGREELWWHQQARATRFASNDAARVVAARFDGYVVRLAGNAEDAAFALRTVLRDVRACLPGPVPEHLIAEIDMLIPRQTDTSSGPGPGSNSHG